MAFIPPLFLNIPVGLRKNPNMEFLRLIVMGAQGVGKSASTVRFMEGYFVEFYDPIIEDSFRRRIEIDSEPVVVEFLDTAITFDNPALRDEYMRMGDGFIVIYSINAKNSFDAAVELVERIKIVKKVQSFPLVIVGNMCDLECVRQVTTQEGWKMASKHKAVFFETSAKFDVNIKDVMK